MGVKHSTGRTRSCCACAPCCIAPGAVLYDEPDLEDEDMKFCQQSAVQRNPHSSLEGQVHQQQQDAKHGKQVHCTPWFPGSGTLPWLGRTSSSQSSNVTEDEDAENSCGGASAPLEPQPQLGFPCIPGSKLQSVGCLGGGSAFVDPFRLLIARHLHIKGYPLAGHSDEDAIIVHGASDEARRAQHHAQLGSLSMEATLAAASHTPLVDGGSTVQPPNSARTSLDTPLSYAGDEGHGAAGMYDQADWDVHSESSFYTAVPAAGPSTTPGLQSRSVGISRVSSAQPPEGQPQQHQQQAISAHHQPSHLALPVSLPGQSVLPQGACASPTNHLPHQVSSHASSHSHHHPSHSQHHSHAHKPHHHSHHHHHHLPLRRHLQPGVHPAVEAFSNGTLSFAFSGGGFFFPYHLGVVIQLSDMGIISDRTPLAGASCGAIITSCVNAGMDLHDLVNKLLDFAGDCREFGTAGRLKDVIQHFMRKCLPPDAHLRCRGKTYISLTKVFPLKPVVISDFVSKEDLVQAISTSCHIPAYNDGSFLARFRGSFYVDGGLTRHLPCLPSASGATYTAGVSCVPYKFLSNLPGVHRLQLLKSLSMSPDFYRPFPFAWQDLGGLILAPASDEVLLEMVDMGKKDAIAWASSVGLTPFMESLAHPPSPLPQPAASSQQTRLTSSSIASMQAAEQAALATSLGSLLRAPSLSGSEDFMSMPGSKAETESCCSCSDSEGDLWADALEEAGHQEFVSNLKHALEDSQEAAQNATGKGLPLETAVGILQGTSCLALAREAATEHSIAE